MKKVLSSILISLVIFVNLLAPIGVGFDKSGVRINKNIAKAERDGSVDAFKKSFSASNITQNQSTYIDEKSTSIDLHVSVDTGLSEGSDTSEAWKYVATQGNIITGTIGGGYSVFRIKNTFILKFTNNETNKTGWLDITNNILSSDLKNKRGDPTMKAQIGVDINIDEINPSTGSEITYLKPGTSHTVQLYYLACTQSACGDAKGNGESIPGISEDKDYYPIGPSFTFTTASKTNQNIGNIGSGNVETRSGKSETMPACNMNPISASSGTFVGCIAQGFYYVLFIPTSYLFALAGTFFDSTFAYSVQDTSYRSSFVVQGWGLVRDFCNMFFIFVLLYVAVGTILDMHKVKTKETIINVVIIGLFINFSLFATQVIIDASNITARVFYNSDAIKITEKGANGVAENTPGLKIGEGGVIPISAAIVNKVNPQNLIINSERIGSIPDNGGASSSDTNGTKNLGAGTFILIVIITSAVNITGFIVFLSIGLMFISRVVGLWIAMILAPLAFFTYILPEQMAGIKMIGWRNWWSDTLKLSFLAPVFIFFMYIILKFLELDLFSGASSKLADGDGLGFVVSVLIPFVFIIILLLKAKDVAKDMSGEMGQKITGAISNVGGLALGAGFGGVAMAGRGVLGSIGNKIASSKTLAGAEAKGGVSGYFAKMALKTGDRLNTSSFDFRATKAGGAFAKETGFGSGMNMISINKGGRKALEANKLAERTKRAEELKHIAEKDESIKKRQAEASKKVVEDLSSGDIKKIDDDLTKERQNLSDAVNQEERAIISNKIKDLVNNKLRLESGGSILTDHHGKMEKNKDGSNKYSTDNGKISKAGYDFIMAEKTKTQDEISKMENERDEIAAGIIDVEETYKKEMEEIKNQRTEEIKNNNGAITQEILNKYKQKENEAESNKEKNNINNNNISSKIDVINNQIEDKKDKAKDIYERADMAEEDYIKAQAENNLGKSIKDFKTEMKNSEHEMHMAGNKIANDYANWINSKTNRTINKIMLRSGYSKSATSEAADKIRLGLKTSATETKASVSYNNKPHTSAPKKEESKHDSGGSHGHH